MNRWLPWRREATNLQLPDKNEHPTECAMSPPMWAHGQAALAQAGAGCDHIERVGPVS